MGLKLTYHTNFFRNFSENSLVYRYCCVLNNTELPLEVIAGKSFKLFIIADLKEVSDGEVTIDFGREFQVCCTISQKSCLLWLPMNRKCSLFLNLKTYWVCSDYLHLHLLLVPIFQHFFLGLVVIPGECSLCHTSPYTSQLNFL